MYLTTELDNPNGAALRLFVESADAAASLGAATAAVYERAILLFDGRDEDQLAQARAQWKRLKEAGFVLAYWQEGERGGWERKQ